MVAPAIGRDIAAGVIGTLIVPRPVGSWLTRWVDRIVCGVFRLATRNIPGLQAAQPGARRAGGRQHRPAGRPFLAEADRPDVGRRTEIGFGTGVYLGY